MGKQGVALALTAAQQELARFDQSRSAEGRFLRYCDRKSRNLVTRMAICLASGIIVGVGLGPRAATVMCGAILLTDAIDSLTLRRLASRQRPSTDLRLPLLLSTLTTLLNAVAMAGSMGYIALHIGEASSTFTLALVVGALYDSLLYGHLHRYSAIARVTVFLGLVALLLGAGWVLHFETPAHFFFDAIAFLLLAYLAVQFVLQVNRTRNYNHQSRRTALVHATELESINEDLRQTRRLTRRLALVAENTNDAVLMMTPEGQINWANDAFSALTGHLQQDVAGKTIADLSGPDTDSNTLHSIRDAQQNRQPIRCEILICHKDGSPIWVDASLTPILDELDRVEAFVAVKRDISIVKEREAALTAARNSAEEAERAKQSFLATMSHEIRTPMTGIIGVADLLADTKLDDDQRRLVETLVNSGNALLSIVNEILDFSKLEAGKLTIRNEPFDLRGLLQSTAQLVDPAARQNGLEFVADLDPELPEFIVGDAGRLRQILLNLLGNSIKFTREGRVHLVARHHNGRAQDAIEIRVIDTGIGMAEDELEAMFDQFAQADTSHSGTGLGLAICRMLANEMGIKLTASSKPDQGTEFCLSFTPRIAAPVEDTPPPVAVPGLARDGAVILIAEDNRTNTFLLERILGSSGAALVFATNGMEAVELYKLHRPDLVLMDIQMPKLDGLDATRAIRAFETDARLDPAPVIALTANVLPESQQACRDAGMNSLQPKPFRKETLYAEIMAHIAKPDHRRHKA